ncbi:putative signal transducing protein [Shewanella sp.]|uniref:putative signal transducing protein n=1 Tax=Shewanella sp. TaxID=50422 RepID=UPI003F39A21A
MEERKHLVASGDLIQAHTWKGLLEQSGIHVELRGEALLGGMGELPTQLHPVELWVGDAQCLQAQAILKALEVESPPWQCVQCHELNAGSFELCWQCSAERSESHNSPSGQC